MCVRIEAHPRKFGGVYSGHNMAALVLVCIFWCLFRNISIKSVLNESQDIKYNSVVFSRKTQHMNAAGLVGCNDLDVITKSMKLMIISFLCLKLQVKL